jgi:superfamily II RNA helicase
MAKRSKRFFRPKRYPRKKPKPPHLKPGADASLRNVFAEIGVPDNPAFTPDAFQLDALSAIESSDCLVTAPTGSGKTWIAEKAIARFYAAGGRSWYACPLKALSNAKYAEFSAVFGQQHVGILTGDRKENPDAPIIVGTTEILRNQLYDAMHRGELLAADFVVLESICRSASHFYCSRQPSATPTKSRAGFLRFVHPAARLSENRKDPCPWSLFFCILPVPSCR